MCFSISEVDTQLNVSLQAFDPDSIYNSTILVSAPNWYRITVLALLVTLGIVGILLNGFVIGCFAICPIVSN